MIQENNINKVVDFYHLQSKIIDIINNVEKLQLLNIFLVKKYSWNRELREFGFNSYQLELFIQDFITIGLIEPVTLSTLDIKIVELIKLTTPQSSNQEIQIYCITQTGLEIKHLAEQKINALIDINPRFNQINNLLLKKVTDLSKIFKKQVVAEQTRFSRELLFRPNGVKIEIQTPLKREIKEFILYLKQNPQLLLKQSKKGELMRLNDNLLFNSITPADPTAEQTFKSNRVRRGEPLNENPNGDEFKGTDYNEVKNQVINNQLDLLKEFGIEPQESDFELKIFSSKEQKGFYKEE